MIHYNQEKLESEMIKQVPNKVLIPAPADEDNTCACSECHFMKMNKPHIELPKSSAYIFQITHSLTHLHSRPKSGSAREGDSGSEGP